MKFTSKNCWAVLLGTLILSQGCGGENGPPMGQVTGKVSYNGEPVNEGLVVFQSDDGRFAAQAELEDGGSFHLKTYLGGVPVGSYGVLVQPPTVTFPDTPDSPGGEGFKEVKNIPQKYRDKQTSGFKANVAAGSNDFAFEMKS
ncbi:hypothetical protein Pan216_36850 [Planctomycetes bacterium Pan216]|uniref:Nickel uptake substrate-specific transmembrane region n=1 Tax=Kolteria novifilia TaxID=2527975 RepID=A0A518B759_9BACT|nr:hypothetical protein Pan216_36850 [Planctomycetes bacterium Pan216]